MEMEEQRHETENVREQTSFFAYLHDLRIDRGIEIEKLSDILGIPQETIRALESGERARLPTDTYLLGMAKKYAVYFHVPYEKLVGLWQEEAAHAISGSSDRLPQNRFLAPRRSWTLSLPLSGAIIFLVLAVSYLGFQLLTAVMPVRIGLDDLPAIVSANTLEISGKITGKARSIRVNNRLVEIQNSRFQTEVFLVPGPNSIRIVAENYLGSATIIERLVILAQD